MIIITKGRYDEIFLYTCILIFLLIQQYFYFYLLNPGILN